FLSRRIFGRQHAIDYRSRDVDVLDHLLREQPLAGSPLLFGLRNRLLNVLGKSLVRLSGQALSVRRLDFPDLRFDWRLARLDLLNRAVVRVRLRARDERMRRLHVTEERRLEAVVIPLWNRIELVIVAARALNRQAQHSPARRRDQIIQVLVPASWILLLAK